MTHFAGGLAAESLEPILEKKYANEISRRFTEEEPRD
jgi:hypothetical protein